MGCDIHSFAEVREEGKWIRNTEKIFPEYGDYMSTEPFGWRNYGMFAFLADVRNYSKIKCIRQPRGLPKDSEYLNELSEYASPGSNEYTRFVEVQEDGNYHTFGYLSLKELADFDYEQVIENRRITVQTGPNSYSGRGEAKDREGIKEILREFLGEYFFQQIEILKSLGEPEDVRIVFWFDD